MTLSPSLTRGWRAFRHRNYRLFFGGQLVSLIGTWMQTVAQSWLVLQLTHDPFMLGVVAAAQFVPVMFFGLFGGLIADQWPKRRTLIFTQTTAMILAFVLFGLTVAHVVHVWHVLLLALLLGIVNAVDMPTRQAFAVEMVGREDITNAVALNSAMFNGARVVGPAVAGLTIGAFDVSVAFFINGLSFLAVICAYLAMRENELRPAPRIDRPHTVRAVLENVGEGLAYVRRTPIVLLATLSIGLVATFGMNFNVLIPALTDEVLHSDASGYGFLMAASGIGSLIAAMGIAFSARNRPWLIPAGTLILAAALVVMGSTAVFSVALVSMLFAGFGSIAMAATANTSIQLTVPDGLRGRVMSVYTTVFAGSSPVGGLLTGALASRFGVGETLVFSGIVSTAVGVGAALSLRRMGGVARPRSVPASTTGIVDGSTLRTARPR
jgi:MFS family permease